MSLSITLPVEIREQVQDIAARKGERVENVVITAVIHYIAHERCLEAVEGQRAQPSRDISEALERSQRLYQGFKDRLRQRHPSLGNLSREQVVVTMERLSEKVTKGMAFATWREAEAFMRGEDRYDFARQQYLHH